MKRKAAWAAVGMIPTLIAANYMPRFVLYAFCAILIIATAIMAFFRYRGRFIRSFFLLVCACIASVFFLAHYEYRNIPLRQYSHKQISAQVVFVSEQSNYWTVRIKNAYHYNKKIPLNGTFAVAVYDMAIEPYDIADVEFVLNEDADSSDHTFGISDFVIHDIESSPDNSIEKHLAQLRKQVITMIQTRIGGEEGNLAAAFLTGDKTDLSHPVQHNFQKTGLSHIMAVSGLHLSIFLGMLSYLLDKASINKKIISAGSLILVGIVAVLANFSVSVLRAGLMCTISLCGYLMNRRADSLNSLGLSLIVIGLLSPSSVIEASYLLSGAATAGILILSPILENQLTSKPLLGEFLCKQLSLICVSISSAIFTAPVLLVYFRELSILSVPAMSLVNYPVTIALIGTVLFCCLFWVPFLGEFLAFLLRIIVQLILDLIDMLCTFEQTTISFHSIPMIVCAICMVLLGLLIYLFKSHDKFRRIACGGLLGILIVSVITMQFYPHIFSRLIVLGGNGECNIFIDKGTSIVVNCGSNYLADQAQDIIREHGFEKIDLLLVTGADAELSNGIPSLLSHIPARRVVISGKEKQNERYCRIIEAANHVEADIIHFTDDTQILVEDIPIHLYNLGDHDINYSVIIDPQQKAVGFFPSIDKQALIHAAGLSQDKLKVNTLITGTCTYPHMIDSTLFYLTDPQTVLIHMNKHFPQKITNKEMMAIIGCGAEYEQISYEHPQHMIDYKIG